MPDFRINGAILRADVDEDVVQAHLRQHYAAKSGTPSLCLCQDIPVRMYIARFGERFILKRWPGSGASHAIDCARFEPPEDASGMAKLAGKAIKTDTLTGSAHLSLGFPLERVPRAQKPPPSAVEDVRALSELSDDAVPDVSSKLSLRGLLHFLWQEAGLNRWRPEVTEKRTWYTVQPQLLAAAGNMVVRDAPLSQRILVPSPFDKEAKDRQARDRTALISSVASDREKRRLLLFLVEIKAFEESAYGWKFTAKHMPERAFFMHKALYQSTMSRFKFDVGAFAEKPENTHLMGIGTMSVSSAGNINVEDVVLMVVEEHWLPFLSLHEHLVIDHSVSTHRKFVKPMKFNMGSNRALATAIYFDTPRLPTALYVKSEGETDALARGRDDLIAKSRFHTTFWDTSRDLMPDAAIDGTRPSI